jgi:hypothetical protein
MRVPFAALPWLVVAVLDLAGATPGRAQTVIRDSAPPPPASAGAGTGGRADTVRARGDTSQRGGTRPDTAARPATPATPAAPVPSAPAADAAPKGVCTNAYGGVATDVLLVTFQRRSTPAERDAAIKAVKGTLVAPDPNDDASAYVRVPSDGNEFALRALADRLIRVRVVKEVGPAACPGNP